MFDGVGFKLTGVGPGDTFIFALVLALRLTAGRLCRLRGVRAAAEVDACQRALKQP
jgi:hypothetical protein